jgi:hypothetical protein
MVGANGHDVKRWRSHETRSHPCDFTLSYIAKLDLVERMVVAAVARARAVDVTDGTRFFNCPAPRLGASLEIMAACVHLELCSDLASDPFQLHPQSEMTQARATTCSCASR